ncbi:MAG: DUF2273 domain-containing protein [Clostridia bacterium]|nr:DUF2273 domain-containing protein [Clostridia bacterium]
MWTELFQEIMTNHRFKFFGAVIGFIFGVVVIKYGIINAILILLATWIGYSVGKGMDAEGSVKNMLAKIFGEK